jgi:hypothetical protein
MKVRILVTCRKLELLPASKMVFDTIRTGFPTAQIVAYLNSAFDPVSDPIVLEAIERAGVELRVIPPTIHHEWVQGLLRDEDSPFFLCDTDVVFWGSMEQFDFGDAALAGRYIPQFFCRFVNAITRPRLHTFLLYMDPRRIREEVEGYFGQFQNTPFNPRPNLVFPKFYPMRTGKSVKTYFEDTCCGLYQALGGRAFNDTENSVADHLNFGTLSDLVGPCYGPREAIRQQHFAVFDQPHILKGAWRTDAEFYRRNAA